MPAITFTTRLSTIGTWTILRLPDSASTMLPSRGMNAVEGTINGQPFQTVLEPDGRGGHWFRVAVALQKIAEVKSSDLVTLAITISGTCPEPDVPEDLGNALAEDPLVQERWNAVTPLARWDWIRWIRATKNPETRKQRIARACSMLGAGKRRPCCFNRNICTETAVSHNGVLLDPEN